MDDAVEMEVESEGEEEEEESEEEEEETGKTVRVPEEATGQVSEVKHSRIFMHFWLRSSIFFFSALHLCLLVASFFFFLDVVFAFLVFHVLIHFLIHSLGRAQFCVFLCCIPSFIVLIIESFILFFSFFFFFFQF